MAEFVRHNPGKEYRQDYPYNPHRPPLKIASDKETVNKGKDEYRIRCFMHALPRLVLQREHAIANGGARCQKQQQKRYQARQLQDAHGRLVALQFFGDKKQYRIAYYSHKGIAFDLISLSRFVAV